MKISWREVERGYKKLSRQIPQKKYDGIICIATGGLIIGKMLADFLDLPLGIVSARRYKTRGGKTRYFSMNTKIHWNRKVKKRKPKILIVDDIIDEGITMEKIIERLGKKFSGIDIAVLYYKKHRTKIDFSKYTIYYYKVVGRGWVTFPWEIL